MGGSGGGFGIRAPSQSAISDVADELRENFTPHLRDILRDVLSIVNDRDTEIGIARRAELHELLSEDFVNYEIKYGGSVHKKTYVEGLSDVDAILEMKNLPDGVNSPAEVKALIAQNLSQSLMNVGITEGSVAITMTYSDGMELQIIPAKRDGDKLMVPTWSGNQWSSINPRKFEAALTKYNESCNGKLIPTIKLAKTILASSPLGKTISGYHVEALAIDVFKNSTSPKTLTSMLPEFFRQASKSVLTPIKDSTGQSVNVDAYLGRPHSKERKDMSHILEGISKRMNAASAKQSASAWQHLFRAINE